MKNARRRTAAIVIRATKKKTPVSGRGFFCFKDQGYFAARRRMASGLRQMHSVRRWLALT